MIDFVKYMLTGLRGRDKTGEREGRREIYFDDDPRFDRSANYQAGVIECQDWLIDLDIFLSRINEQERYLFIRYYICDDSCDKIALDVDISRATINRIIRSVDCKLASHLYGDKNAGLSNIGD